jgi:hypothetical protein
MTPTAKHHERAREFFRDSCPFDANSRELDALAALLAAVEAETEARVREEALEEAAKVCDALAHAHHIDNGDSGRERQCADEIRALKRGTR